MRHESPLVLGALAEDHRTGNLGAQSSGPVDNAARPISDEQFRDWLNERLNQPDLYDLEAELLQARWSA